MGTRFSGSTGTGQPEKTGATARNRPQNSRFNREKPELFNRNREKTENREKPEKTEEPENIFFYKIFAFFIKIMFFTDAKSQKIVIKRKTGKKPENRKT